MPDWSALRRRAYQHHLRLRARLSGDTALLPPADRLLGAAEKETGIRRTPVPPDDPLLSEAHAVLDREAGRIFYARGRGVSAARQRLAQAHEFAHYWLHGDLAWDACQADDTPLAFLPPSVRAQSAQVAEGYSPRQRQETEANIFAAELLLPRPVLYRLFTKEGWNAARIAAYAGLSESCVLAQLVEALLLPAPPETLLADEDVTPLESLSGAGLDPSQREAAHIAAGPVLVDAGPGTGKTRTLVARILYLLREQNIPPDNILAVTFTNKAAEEMRTRLRGVVGAAADRVWIGTFHAFGYEILRRDGHRIGLPPAPPLMEPADAVALLEHHLDHLQLEEFEYLSQPALPFMDILSCISRAKDELKTPEHYFDAAMRQLQAAGADEKALRAARKSLEVAHIYEVYQQLLRERGALDFGDLILRAVELLDTCSDVQVRWQTQFPHVLADEYQDINRASAQLLRRIAGDGRGFWAVGDLRQTICRFRGAAPANLTEFERDFPGGRRLQLTRNYRSLPPLVALFSAMAEKTGKREERKAKQEEREEQAQRSSILSQAQSKEDESAERTFSLFPFPFSLLWRPHRSDDGQPAITVAVAEDEEAQADGLAEQIRERHRAGVPWQDQAVLCRTNRQATDLAERLERRGIPVQHLGDLFDRTEVKDLLALISLACEPKGTTLARVAQFLEYGVPIEDVTRLLEAARQQSQSFPAALKLAADLPDLSEGGRQGLLQLWRQLEPIAYRGDAWMLLARYLFTTSAYLHPLLAADTVAARRQRLALYQLLQFTQKLTERLPVEEGESGQAAFLAHLFHLRMCGEDKASRLPADADALDAVRILTIHVSKGLEFPVVYLPNLTENHFSPRPGGRMASPPPGLLEDVPPDGDEDGEGADDACLFFVALSRARDHLLLSRPLKSRGKALPPAALLESLAPALAACGAQMLVWSANPLSESRMSTEDTEDTDKPPASVSVSSVKSVPSVIQTGEMPDTQAPDRPTVSLSALETYADCPRKYYYRYVARIPERGDTSPYLVFHLSLQQTLQWLQTERAAGHTPALPDALSRLESLWSEYGPDLEGGHIRLLRRRAEEMVTAAFRQIGQVEAIRPQTDLIADLPNGRVQMSCDRADLLPDGTLRLVRHSTTRASQADTHGRRYALYRAAARQQDPNRPVQISVAWLRDGQTTVRKELKHNDERYLEEHNETLAGIRDGHFDPDPQDRKCVSCPYFLICPA